MVKRMPIDLNKLSGKTRKELPPRVVLYGPGGIGKSSFAASAPAPVFFDVEKGLHGIKNTENSQDINTWADAMEMLGALYQQKHEFQTVVVDSLDWLETLAQRQVCAEQNVKFIEDVGYGKGYVTAAEMMQQFLQGLDALRSERDMTIICLAHDQITKMDNPLTEAYDRYSLKMHKKTAALVHEWADAVLFMAPKVYIRKEKGDFGKESKKGVSGGRVLYTEDTPAYQAKNRACLALPAEIQLPEDEIKGWETFIISIGAK